MISHVRTIFESARSRPAVRFWDDAVQDLSEQSLISAAAILRLMSSSVMDLFEKAGGYLRGHFRLTSGLHSPEYLQCAKVLAHPTYAERLGIDLAAKLKAMTRTNIDVVFAPALGGLIIGHEVARALGASFLFTERDPTSGKMTLRRGFEVQPGKAAVVVEDVITTGGSSREVVELVRAAGGEVVAGGSIIDRSGGSVDIGAPRIALEELNVVTYEPDVCPLCKQGIPVVKPGSRKG